MAFSTQSWGAIIAPFIVGLIADRYFNAERILGVIHLAGAVLMYLMANTTEFSVFFPYVLIYMILFMPTLALVNSISFRQMANPAEVFAKVRSCAIRCYPLLPPSPSVRLQSRLKSLLKCGSVEPLAGLLRAWRSVLYFRGTPLQLFSRVF